MANLVQIEKFLDDEGIKYRVVDLGGKIFKVNDVIAAGVNSEEIVKTLVVRIPATNFCDRKKMLQEVNFVALVVRGRDRADFKKVRKLLGPSTTSITLSASSLRVNCELAKPEEVQKIVGVPVGAVCPILIGIPLIFDRKVMGLKRANLGSGDLTKGLDMDLKDLLKAVGDYRVEDLV